MMVIMSIIKTIIRHPLMKYPKILLMPIWRKIYSSRRIKHFASNSEYVVSKVQETLSLSDNLFYFDFGTLLGMYRDGALLMRDMDIDVGVQIKDVSDIVNLRKLMTAHGFIHKYIFKTQEFGVIQDTFDCHDVTVDVNYYYVEGEKDITYMLYDDNLVLKLIHTHITKTSQIPFKSVRVNAPGDVELYLIEKYGNNWKIPDPSYKYWNNPLYKKLDIKGTCEKLDK